MRWIGAGRGWRQCPGPEGREGAVSDYRAGGQNYFIYLQKQDLLDRTFKDNTEFFVKIYL